VAPTSASDGTYVVAVAPEIATLPRSHWNVTVAVDGVQPVVLAVSVEPTAGVPEIVTWPGTIATARTGAVGAEETVADTYPAAFAVAATVKVWPTSDSVGTYVSLVTPIGRPSRDQLYVTVAAAGVQPEEDAVRVEPTARVPEIEAAPPVIVP
jgi:hypothetical protein